MSETSPTLSRAVLQKFTMIIQRSSDSGPMGVMYTIECAQAVDAPPIPRCNETVYVTFDGLSWRGRVQNVVWKYSMTGTEVVVIVAFD